MPAMVLALMYSCRAVGRRGGLLVPAHYCTNHLLYRGHGPLLPKNRAVFSLFAAMGRATIPRSHRNARHLRLERAMPAKQSSQTQIAFQYGYSPIRCTNPARSGLASTYRATRRTSSWARRA